MIFGLFWVLTLSSSGYAALRGGKDGRWAAVLVLAASFLSVPALLLGRGWLRTETGLLGADVVLLIGLCTLALHSRRYFPIWMAGLQIVPVTTHLATVLAPAYSPRVYQALEQVWAIPILLTMTIGIAMDRRRHLAPG